MDFVIHSLLITLHIINNSFYIQCSVCTRKKKTFGIRREANNKTNVLHGCYWINMVQDRVQRRVLENGNVFPFSKKKKMVKIFSRDSFLLRYDTASMGRLVPTLQNMRALCSLGTSGPCCPLKLRHIPGGVLCHTAAKISKLMSCLH